MTDWQQQYLTGDTPWDRGAPAPALTDFLKDHPLTGKILVPGCGTGHDVRLLAESGASGLTGLDVAPLAVELARRRLSDLPNAEILLADLFEACQRPPLAGTFDLVWEHTCYCAIPPERRPDYVAAAAAALKPGGELLGVFYLNPWGEGEDQKQGPPFGTGLEELHTIFSSHFEPVRGWNPKSAYPGREGREWCGLFRRKS